MEGTILVMPLENNKTEINDGSVSTDVQPDSKGNENTMQDLHCTCNEEAFAPCIGTSKEATLFSPTLLNSNHILQKQWTASGAITLCETSEEEALLAQRLHQSMNHIHSTRSLHNRRMGSSLEYISDERDIRGLKTRVDDFEALLADL